MSDTSLRKRSKKTQKKSHAGEAKSKQADGHSNSGSPSIFSWSLSISDLVWLVVSVGILGVGYFNPHLVKEFIGFWIGFSDHYDDNHYGALKDRHNGYLPADPARRDAVVRAFKHAWGAYERDAMGFDEYHPISRNGSNLSSAGGIGYTVIDSLDTMQLMGLKEEYSRARHWVETKLTFDRDGEFSTFETTIRVLGGLLSAYELSGRDPLFLEKAVEIADRLLPAFADGGLPFPYVNLLTGEVQYAKEFLGLVSVAEIGTLQLEFRYLAHLTGNVDYWRAVERVMQIIKSTQLPHNMASLFLEREQGRYITSAISLGSRGDSFYEYLLKQYLQTNRTESVYTDMYQGAMDGIHQHLIQESQPNKMLYTSELRPEEHANGEISWRLTPKQDHLVCFLGGSLMLGAVTTGALKDTVSRPPKEDELTPTAWRDWKTGTQLIKTCMHTHNTATGLSPEIVYFRVPSDGMDQYEWAPSDWYIRGAQPGAPVPYDARYMLRPETVESLFIAYRLTGDELYREHGFGIFQAIEKHCRVETGGYATIINVDANPSEQEDKMETFFLSETLKYLYLLFSDSDILPLDRYIFNTEAHPLPIFEPEIDTRVF